MTEITFSSFIFPKLMPRPPAVKVPIALTPTEGKVCLVRTPPHTQPHTESNWFSMENEMYAALTSVFIYYYHYVGGDSGYHAVSHRVKVQL
jgi:hypothetical protein